MTKLPEGISVIHMVNPNFAEKVVEITTPQFERLDDITPAENPGPLFSKLHLLSEATLRQLGMAPWGEFGLWLFPYQWYKHIPADFEVVDIFGATEKFIPGQTDDDSRCGCLAYGIVPNFEKAP